MKVPIKSILFKALLKCIPYLTLILEVCYLVFRSIPGVECFVTPTISRRSYCLSTGTSSAMKMTFMWCLKTLQVATLSAALQSISGYFSCWAKGIVKSEKSQEPRSQERTGWHITLILYKVSTQCLLQS